MSDLVVLFRIAIWIVVGRLVTGGWLPEDIAAQLTSPEMIEVLVGALVGVVTMIWYWLSEARKSLLKR